MIAKSKEQADQQQQKHDDRRKESNESEEWRMIKEEEESSSEFHVGRGGLNRSRSNQSNIMSKAGRSGVRNEKKRKLDEICNSTQDQQP